MDILEDPTLPLTRGDIERLRRRHHQGPSTDMDGRPRAIELFESLEDFIHIGFKGTPVNMRTSGQGQVLSGEIEATQPCLDEITVQMRRPLEPGPDETAPLPRPGQLSGSWPAPGEHAGQLSGSWSEPLQSLPVGRPTSDLEIIDDLDILEELEPSQRLRWPWATALAATAATLAAWLLWPDSEPADSPPPLFISAAEVPISPREFPPPVPTSTPNLAPIPSEDSEDSTRGEAILASSGKNRDIVSSASCRQARAAAASAFSLGEWASVESLTQRKECWAHVREAYALRLRAMFELGRFDECIKLASRDSSPAVKKWRKTCEDAKI